MPRQPNVQTFRHVFAGGWSTDRGPTAEVSIGPDGLVRIPFLEKAENIYYELDGGPHKIGGTTRINSTAAESGEQIRGGFDYWRQGTGGSPTQKRILVAGQKILKDDADGDFSDELFTGQDDDKVPSFSQFDDIAFICSNSTTNLPRQWDQTTAKIVQTGSTVASASADDATFSGTWNSDTVNTTIYVEIDANGSPDTFKWELDGAEQATGVNCELSPGTALVNGISVFFDSTTSHTIGDNWTYTIGLAPNLSFMTFHKNRMWGAGDPANPSQLYYSVTEDPEDWNGSGSGTIAIDPQDGDQITGIISHKNELWVFKGPYKGSIHRITGSSPSDFARTTFIRGLGAVWQNLIFRFRDDIGFMWTDGTVRSLNATAAFGDFVESSISLDINNWLREHINFSRLKYGWAADCSSCSRVYITIPIDSSSDNNATLSMDYRFDPVRWSYWSDIEAASVFTLVDSGQQIAVAGGNDGFLRKLDQTTRSIDGATGIKMDVLTPFLRYGDPNRMKTIERISLGLATKGASVVDFIWQRDDEAEQNTSISQAGGDVLGPASSNVFTLGTSTLSGGGFADRFKSLEEGGEFRSIRFGVRNSGVSEDVEIHSVATTLAFGAVSGEN